jgi:uncharacterized protein (DUF2141 family)
MNSRSALALATRHQPARRDRECRRRNPAPPPLDVTVTGLHSTKGALLVCLWKDKAGFPTCQKSKTAMQRRVAITATTMRVNFAGHCAGPLCRDGAA